MSAARRLYRLACFLLASAPAVLSAQVPAGTEAWVNTYTTDGQRGPSAAMGGSGNFVVSWHSYYQDGDHQGIYAQRFAASGGPRGAEFRVNTSTTNVQIDPSVAMDGSGDFVVVWMSSINSAEIFGQRYRASGAPRGGEFRVNSYTTASQYRPAVASDRAGDFVVVWMSHYQDGDYSGIFGQRYAASGVPLGAEFRVNTYTTGGQTLPSAAMGPGGRFVVAWDSSFQDGSGSGVFAQRFDGAGLPSGAEFLVNTYTSGGQYAASVAMSPAGDFVVTWSGDSPGAGAYQVFGQRFDASGMPSGTEFLVNTYTTEMQGQPSVAMDEAGNCVVAWYSFLHGGVTFEIFGQRFDAAGVRRGAEFHVNTFTTGSQIEPSVAVDASGNFVVAWRSEFNDWGEIFAQRFGGLLPAALTVDPSGNGVWEPGESVEMKPTWSNVNGSPQTFAAGLTGITGPPGATYSIVDGTASYGTVANGASAQCTDCYAVGVSDPATRPALHWDASVLESITPDVQGQVKRWTLHIGKSFTDVPSTNPFHRFIETLLHKGITGGCGGMTYCPGNATTRDQMSVFVLLAKEGAGYAPPACTTPVFNDVPAANPFCRYIEELSRRGVASGCGGGNYCPTNPVTREQMAVFVLRTLDPALNPPDCTTPVFNDVPASSGFCKWIEELVRRGVVSGCGNGNYCPTNPVTREQMGVFLSATFNLTLYGL